MSWKFNPFTGILDIAGTGQATQTEQYPYLRVPTKLVVGAGSSFSIQSGSGALMFVRRIASTLGLVVIGALRVEDGSSLVIQSGSSGTVLGA